MSERQETVFIALGSNIERRECYLARAILELGQVGVLQKLSSIYETAPLGSSENNYLNQVVQLKTKLSAEKLLLKLKTIEKQLGRKKRGVWAEREIDLDILLYGGQRVWRPDLQIPHAVMHHRRFVLMPLAEIAPDLVHPVFGFNIPELLKLSSRDLTVRVWGS